MLINILNDLTRLCLENLIYFLNLHEVMTYIAITLLQLLRLIIYFDVLILNYIILLYLYTKFCIN